MEFDHLVRFFGLQVCVQFREPLAVCVPDPTKLGARKVPVLTEDGLMQSLRGPTSPPQNEEEAKQILVRPTWKMELLRKDGEPVFSLIFPNCVLTPGKKREIVISYEHDENFLEMVVDPSLIAAVSTVAGIREKVVSAGLS